MCRTTTFKWNLLVQNTSVPVYQIGKKKKKLWKKFNLLSKDPKNDEFKLRKRHIFSIVYKKPIEFEQKLKQTTINRNDQKQTHTLKNLKKKMYF